MEWQKNNEITSKSQAAAMKEVVSRKDKQIEEMSSQCQQLQNNMISLERQLW